MPRQLQAASEAIAGTVSPVVGIDPVTIITIVTTLLTLVSQFCPRRSEENQLKAVRKAYDPATQSYDRTMVSRFEFAAKKACRREGVKRPTKAQCQALALAALEKIRTADEVTAIEVLAQIGARPETRQIVADCG